MSYFVNALLLIRLEGRTGNDVGVRELADHVGVPDPDIEAALNELEHSHKLRVQRQGGLPVSACVMPRADEDR